MRDRGTLLAAAGIAAAFLVAGVLFLYQKRTEEAVQHAAEEADAADRARFEADPEKWRAERGLNSIKQIPIVASDPAIAKGVELLRDQQSADGAWRSSVYATFKNGPALTPLVVCALQEAGVPGNTAAIRKGCEYLAKLVIPDSTIEGDDGGLDYPVYSAALTVKALSHPDQKDLLKARDAWLKFLLDRQLTEKFGWKPEDKQYGGWGYCRFIPKKQEPGAIAPPLIESNLSATVFALEALKAAGVKDHEVYERAMVFVRRCQNHDLPVESALMDTKDGGFHFIYDDPVRNKAGSMTLQPEKFKLFFSYGSATADGLRCLLLEDRIDARRTLAATNWLKTNFKPDSHPGGYVKAQESNREAVYYYYAASVSKALRAAKVTEAGGKPWAAALATELVNRQKPDGSWANPVELVRENEPLVATANAIIALANCKAALVGK